MENPPWMKMYFLSSWWLSHPFEKYESNWIISPNRDEHKKCLKPPPIYWKWRFSNVMLVFRGVNQPPNHEFLPRFMTQHRVALLWANFDLFWFVVSTHLKNISQNGNLPQGSGWKFTQMFELPPPSFVFLITTPMSWRDFWCFLIHSKFNLIWQQHQKSTPNWKIICFPNRPPMKPTSIPQSWHTSTLTEASRLTAIEGLQQTAPDLLT